MLIKLRHCFISITAKNKIQETTLRNFCYFDNYKTRLSMTKYLGLRNKYQKKKWPKYDAFEAQWGGGLSVTPTLPPVATLLFCTSYQIPKSPNSRKYAFYSLFCK